MSLFSRAAFEKLVSGLPGTTLVDQWEAHVGKVGGKVFVLLGQTGENLVFKVSETAFAGLTTLEGVGQAAYFAKGQWVSVTPEAELTAAELGAYVAESHKLVAAKLTRKVRAELGLA